MSDFSCFVSVYFVFEVFLIKFIGYRLGDVFIVERVFSKLFVFFFNFFIDLGDWWLELGYNLLLGN